MSEAKVSHWNHRVVTDGEKWWVGEIYYHGNRIMGCTDGDGLLADWETEEEVRNTVARVAAALDKPSIRLLPDGNHEELP